MGSASIQGALWGARAHDWATVQEPAWQSVFDRAVALAGALPGIELLDVGCGTGGALAAARAMGAEVAGLDASPQLVEWARRRLPGARIEVGDMESLPFDNRSFDVVMGINSFQFAENIVGALAEACRVCRSDGTLLLLVWGPRDECELISLTVPAVLAHLPPAPEALPQVWLGDEGVAEGFLRQAGLEVLDTGHFMADLAFPDTATAVRAVLAASARAIESAGEERIAAAVRSTLRPVTGPDGSIVWKNKFRWIKARPDL